MEAERSSRLDLDLGVASTERDAEREQRRTSKPTVARFGRCCWWNSGRASYSQLRSSAKAALEAATVRDASKQVATAEARTSLLAAELNAADEDAAKMQRPQRAGRDAVEGGGHGDKEADERAAAMVEAAVERAHADSAEAEAHALQQLSDACAAEQAAALHERPRSRSGTQETALAASERRVPPTRRLPPNAKPRWPSSGRSYSSKQNSTSEAKEAAAGAADSARREAADEAAQQVRAAVSEAATAAEAHKLALEDAAEKAERAQAINAVRQQEGLRDALKRANDSHESILAQSTTAVQVEALADRHDAIGRHQATRGQARRAERTWESQGRRRARRPSSRLRRLRRGPMARERTGRGARPGGGRLAQMGATLGASAADAKAASARLTERIQQMEAEVRIAKRLKEQSVQAAAEEDGCAASCKLRKAATAAEEDAEAARSAAVARASFVAELQAAVEAAKEEVQQAAERRLASVVTEVRAQANQQRAADSEALGRAGGGAGEGATVTRGAARGGATAGGKGGSRRARERDRTGAC